VNYSFTFKDHKTDIFEVTPLVSGWWDYNQYLGIDKMAVFGCLGKPVEVMI
jgi:hypothetical protein